VTLIELLVVLAIIAILAATLIPTIGGAIRRTKTARIAVELNQLAQAIEAYKAKFNDYPPDFTNWQAVQQHIKTAFPRAAVDLNLNNTGGWWYRPHWDTTSGSPNPDPKMLDPAEALVFWLSAIKANARDPLDIDNAHPNAVIDGAGDPVSFFTFETARLTDIDGDGWPEYSPQDAPDAPYVYFDGRLLAGIYRYENAVYGGGLPHPILNSPPSSTSTPTMVADIGTARPYRSNTTIDSRDNGRTVASTGNTTTWVDPGRYQIISAGLDQHYGDYAAAVFKTFPDINYAMTSQDEDNLASFSDGRTIGDSVP